MARYQNKVEFEIYDPELESFKFLENVEYPIQGEDYLDTSKDVATIIIDGSRESRRIIKGTRINKYIKVVNLDTQEETPRELVKEYIVEQDIVETIRFFDPKLYKHNISLVETIKDTEGYQLTNLTFSYYQPYIYRIYSTNDFVNRIPGRKYRISLSLENGKYGGYLQNINRDIEYWLMNDLDFTGVDFHHTNFYELQGSFYGMGHTISNIQINLQKYYYKKEILDSNNTFYEMIGGFFTYIDEGAVVSDLTLFNPKINFSFEEQFTSDGDKTLTGFYAGFLAGYSNGLIRNCHVIGGDMRIDEEIRDQYIYPNSGVKAYKNDGMIKSIGFLAGGATKVEQCSSSDNYASIDISTEKESDDFSYPPIPADTPYYDVERKQHQVYVSSLVGSMGKRKIEFNYGFQDYDYNSESFDETSPYYISEETLNTFKGVFKVDNFLNKTSRTWIKDSYVANNEMYVDYRFRSILAEDIETDYTFDNPSCKYFFGGLCGSKTNILKSFVYGNDITVGIFLEKYGDVNNLDKDAQILEYSTFATETENNLNILNNFYGDNNSLTINDVVEDQFGFSVINKIETPEPSDTTVNGETYPALTQLTNNDFTNINTFIYDSENTGDIRNWEITDINNVRAKWLLESGDSYPSITKDTYSKIDPYKGYSIIDIIQRIIDNSDYKVSEFIPMTKDNIDNKNAGGVQTQEKRWVISESLKDKMTDKDTKTQNRIYKRSPEFFLRTPNAWEALLEVGAYINGIPFIKNGNEIDYFLLNRDETQWDNEPRKSTHSQTQNGPQYASNLLSFDDNVILEDKQEEKYLSYPAPNQYITPRSENPNVGRITNDNSAVVLPEDIYSLRRVRIKLDNLSGVDNTQEYDITDYIYEGKVYNALEDTEEGKGLAIIFDQYDNTIFGFTDQPIKGYKPPLPSLQRIIEDVTGVSVPSDYQFYNVKFNVEYYPHYDTVSNAVRESDEDYQYQFTNYMQQSENKMNVELLSEYKQNRLNQLANIEEGVSYETDNWFMVPKPGEKLNDYYVNIVQWEVYPQTVRFNVAFTKDYNRISEYKDIQRRKRPYPIPGQLLEDKRVLFDEFLVFKSTPHNKENTSKLTSQGLNSVFSNILTNSFIIYLGVDREIYDYKAVSNCILDTGVYNKYTQIPTHEFKSRTILPVTGSISDDGIKFDVSFSTNVSAGSNSIYYGSEKINFPFPSLTEDLEYVSNNQVLYGKNGFVDFISPKFISIHRNFDNYDFNDYPAYSDGNVINPDIIPDYREGIIRVAGQTNLLSEPYKQDIMLIDFSNFFIDIFKDAREILKFVYEIQYVKEDKNIIIGNKLKQDNPLIRHEPAEYGVINVYLLDKKINKYQETIDADNAVKLDNLFGYDLSIDPTSSTDGIKLSIDFTNSLIFQNLPNNTAQSWVITDNEDNILIGKNQEITDTNSVSEIYVQGYDNTYRIKNNLK